MIAGHVFIAVSLDGFVARSDHRLDWLMKQDTSSEDHGYEQFFASIDGIVMGRGSYEIVLTFDEWPYTKPVIVLSHTLRPEDIPDHLSDRVRVSSQSPAKLMNQLQQKGWSNVYIDGGRVVQSFIRASLVDEIVLSTIPILIGDGIRLFGELDSDIDLSVLESKSYPSGIIQTHYRIK